MIKVLVLLALLTPMAFLVKAPRMLSGAYVGRVIAALLIFWVVAASAAYLERESESTKARMDYGDIYDLLCGVMDKGWLIGLMYLSPWILIQGGFRGIVRLTRKRQKGRESPSCDSQPRVFRSHEE